MGKTIKLTNETFLQRLSTVEDYEEYEFLDEYKNYETKLRCKHKTCGYIYEVNPHHFFAGNRCPKCANNIKRTTSSFNEELRAKFDGRYENLSEYKNNISPIQVRCNKCMNTFKAYPVKILSGRECPFCCNRNNSKGRQTIQDFLTKNNFDFIAEYDELDCKGQSGKTKLKFDFFIPSKKLIIEYDGEFHYINKYENQRFTEQQENDKIKDKFCKDNNINLLRIPYWYLSRITSILREVFKRKDTIYIPIQESINQEINFSSTTIESTEKSGSE